VIAWLLACSTPTTVESWELIALNHDLAALHAWGQVSDLGWFRGQGELGVMILPRSDSPWRFVRDGLPAETLVSDGVQVGPSGLLSNGSGWALVLQEDGFAGRVHITPSVEGGTSTVSRAGKRWTVAAPVAKGSLSGFVGGEGAEILVDGHGVILHRQGDDPPGLRGTTRTTVVVVSEALSIGIDQAGGQALAWASMAGVDLSSDSAVLERKGGGRYRVDLRPDVPVHGRVVTRRRQAETAVHRGLYTPERAVLKSWIGTPVRRLRAAEARLEVAGAEVNAPAVVVEIVYK